MTDRQLVAFMECIELGSITKAANALHVSPQSLSEQLSRLERELGFDLMVRSHGGVSPSCAGKAFYEGLVPLRRDFEALASSCRAMATSDEALRVGQLPMFVLSPVMATALKKLHPHLNVVYVPLDPQGDSALQAVANGSIDVLDWIFDKRVFKLGLAFTKLATLSNPVCLVRDGHPLGSHARLHTNDIASYPIGILDPVVYGNLIETLRDNGWKGSFSTIPCNQLSVSNFCLNTDGVLFSVGEDIGIRGLRAIPFNATSLTWDIGIVHRPNPTPDVRAYLDTMKQLYAHDLDPALL